MKRRPKTRSITIIGRQWFDRINGNSYFSAVGLVNGKAVVVIDFNYGHSSMYEQQIGIALDKEGYIKRERYPNGDYVHLWLYCRDNNIKLYSTIANVRRKKDLIINN